jgi:hypothetical protein
MAPKSSLGFATTAMGVLLLFLLGYLYAGWRSQWEKQMLVDGTVAYFANAKILRPGLEDNVVQVRERLKLLTDELGKLPQSAAEVSKEQSEEAAKRLKVIKDNLILCDAKLADIEKTYGYSYEERKALAWFIEQKQAELRRLVEAQADSKTTKQSTETQPAAKKPGATQPSAIQPTPVEPRTDKTGAPRDATKNKEAPATDTGKKSPPSGPAQPKK